MHYEKYMDLCFTRHDLRDEVQFKQTGYHGFYLERKITNNIKIGVNSGELDKPKLYIKKYNEEAYHIIDITPEMVTDLLCEGYNYTKNINKAY